MVSPAVEHPEGYVGGRLFSTPGVPIVLRTDFDVEAYQADANGYLDISQFGAEPAVIDAETGRLLAFAWRLESSALAETRAILSTWSANEARIAAFIATWAFERFWMGRALRDLLADAGIDATAPRRTSLTARAKDVYVERLLPLVEPVVGGVVKEPVSAGHMARMAYQEGALDVVERTLLSRMDAVTAGPEHGAPAPRATVAVAGQDAAEQAGRAKARDVLAEVVSRRQPMLEFFRAEATARVTRSASERFMAGLHTVRPWAPLRVVGVPDPDENFALTHLFTTGESWRLLRAADSHVGDLLPGRPRPTVKQVRAALGRAHHGF